MSKYVRNTQTAVWLTVWSPHFFQCKKISNGKLQMLWSTRG